MKKLTTPQRSSLVYLVCLLFIASTTIQPSGIASSIATNDYDVVILHGRVIDPESKLDAVRNIGINKGTAQAVTSDQINARVEPARQTRADVHLNALTANWRR